MMDHKLRPFLLEVNHSPSFTCDSPLDLSVKSSVLRATMEMVSPSKEEWKVFKKVGRARLPPEVREQLIELREEYESSNSDRLGFDSLYPPSAAAFDGDESEAEALLARYDGYIRLATEIYGNMSLSGSRRAVSNCGSKLATSSSNDKNPKAAPGAAPGAKGGKAPVTKAPQGFRKALA